jgi:hypothetical protein
MPDRNPTGSGPSIDLIKKYTVCTEYIDVCFISKNCTYSSISIRFPPGILIQEITIFLHGPPARLKGLVPKAPDKLIKYVQYGAISTFF